MDSVSGESDTGNNCSTGAAVAVGAALGNPANQRYSWEGSTTVLSWDAVADADYYKIYYDDFFSSGCRLSSSGSSSFCDELAADVEGTSYTHTSPDHDDNYYWVTACNIGGCSEIDSDNPASLEGSATAPDLVVDPPTVSDSAPAAGGSFTLSATVRNQGSGPSDSTTLRYYRSTDSSITSGDTAVGTDYVSRLDASESGDESVRLTAPSTPGTYYYGACVDSVSGESDTGNNCSGVVAVAVGTPPAPDLVVDKATVSDSAPAAGASFTLSATVRNQGSGSSDSTTLRYYRSADSSISSSDTAVGTDSVSGLSASRTSAEDISLTAPPTSGTYYYGACVDSVSGESDTGNNCSTGAAVAVGAALGNPANQRYSWEGSTTVLSWDAVADADYYKIYYDDFFSSGCRLSSSGSSSFCDELAADVEGTSYTHTSPDHDDNYYWVTACNIGGCSEIDSDNPASLEGSATAPDLVVDPPTVSDSAPAAGGSFTLSATVRNQGSGPSDSTTLRYYRSTDSSITSGDTAVGTDYVSRLDASESGDESVRLTAPSTPGTYYYGACVDAVSDESDTTNNCSTGVAVAVGEAPAPDLVVDPPTVSDSAPAAGGSFTLSATVRNQGSGPSASTTLRYYQSADSTISSSDTAVGTDSVSGLSASGTSAEDISLTAPPTSGTYYYGACVDSVSGESDTGNNCSTGVAVAVGEALGNPANQRYSWEGSTTVLSWDAVADADYYKIYYDDFFSSGCRLSSSGSSSFCDELAADVEGTSYTHTSPDHDDNYYWVTACNIGGCSEIDSDNPASLEGSATAPDLVVDPPTVSDSAPAAGGSFTLSATVRNQGSGPSDSTTLRYYRSTDSSITSGDTAVGTDYVSRLDASESGDESVRLTAPSTPGTYYYGACVDSVSGESDTGNNCSGVVAVAVGTPPAPDLVVGQGDGQRQRTGGGSILHPERHGAQPGQRFVGQHYAALLPLR